MTRRRVHWDELPAAVRRDVERELSVPVLRADEPDAGHSSDFSATLHTEHGPVFCKAVERDSPRARTAWHERSTNALLPSSAPRLLWTVETDGWLVLGYEHVPGQHADFAPGSPDLEPTARLLAETTSHHVTDERAFTELGSYAAKIDRVSPWRTLRQRSDALTAWEREHLELFVDREWFITGALALGDGITHSDLHEGNVMIDGVRARLIDWAWVCRAPTWVDPTFWVVRMIGAGHDPRTAEQWAERVPAWADASGSAVTAFSLSILGLWRLHGRFEHLKEAALRYAMYRLDEH